MCYAPGFFWGGHMKSVLGNSITLFKTAATIETTTCIRSIFSKLGANSVVFLDLDDTVGRVNQAMGLDAWFRFRINQFSAEGHSDSEALNNAIILYNQAQMASKEYVAVEGDVDIANEIEKLKAKNIHVFGLTARNHVIADKTHELLTTLGVSFSDQVLADSEFHIGEAKVVIKQGIIFANGQNKGVCLGAVYISHR